MWVLGDVNKVSWWVEEVIENSDLEDTTAGLRRAWRTDNSCQFVEHSHAQSRRNSPTRHTRPRKRSIQSVSSLASTGNSAPVLIRHALTLPFSFFCTSY